MKKVGKVLLTIIIIAIAIAEVLALFLIFKRQEDGFKDIKYKIDMIEKKVEEKNNDKEEKDEKDKKDDKENKDSKDKMGEKVDKIEKKDIRDIDHNSSAKDMLNAILSNDDLENNFKDFLKYNNTFKNVKKDDRETQKELFGTEFDFEEVYASISISTAHPYITAIIKAKDKDEAKKIQEKLDKNIKNNSIFEENKPEEVEVENKDKYVLVSSGNEIDVKKIEELFENIR